MFDRLVKALLGASLAAALSVSVGLAQDAAAPPAPAAAAPGAAPAQPKVKDQGEYDALTAASKETDLTKKLALLKAWQDKYPDSEFKNQRLLSFIDTWSKIAAHTLQTPPTADSLAAGKDAAQNLLDNLDKAFASDVKPAQVSDDQWKQARAQVEQQAHITLGWVGWQQGVLAPAGDEKTKDYQTAEAEFKKTLELNDQSAQVSYWLGTVIVLQKKTERTPEALYHFARSVVVTGPNALAPQGKTTADTYLAKSFAGYHGEDAKALQDLKDLAAKSALPPADYKLPSVVEIDKQKAGSEEAYLAQHPDIKLWRELKAALLAPDGEDYFGKNVKGSIIPKEFTAKVVSMTPETDPTEVKVSIDQAESPQGDAVIKFQKPVKVKADVVGTNIQLQGYADSFTKDPFAIAFNGEESKIKGLTIAAAKPPVHHPAARRHK